jgi:hypothetical protein
MSNLFVLSHASSKYSPRTYENARSADFTFALAADLNTAGEKLTKKAAGAHFLAVEWTNNTTSLEVARLLFQSLKMWSAHSINVAGNGMATLARHGLTQAQANQIIYEVLAQVHAHWPLTHIRSGGQTGVDLAGAVAGVALGIPTTVLLPLGFIQRDEYGTDAAHSPDFIREQIQSQSKLLLPYTVQHKPISRPRFS